MGVYRIMDLLRKLDMMIDTTVAGDVATNTAKGKIDVIGGECPKGTVYDKVKKVCVPSKNESTVASFVVGSGQTRVWGSDFNLIDALENKEPVTTKMADKAKENIEGRMDLKFDSILGIYAPKKDDVVDTSQMEN
jgi:hypothetical protein